jgi:hypothetical protein
VLNLALTHKKRITVYSVLSAILVKEAYTCM